MCLSIVVPVRDQVLMCERIMEGMNIHAASSVKDDLICLKLFKLNLTVMMTFFYTIFEGESWN